MAGSGRLGVPGGFVDNRPSPHELVSESIHPADRLLALWQAFATLEKTRSATSLKDAWIRVLNLDESTTVPELYPWLIDAHGLVVEVKAILESSDTVSPVILKHFPQVERVLQASQFDSPLAAFSDAFNESVNDALEYAAFSAKIGIVLDSVSAAERSDLSRQIDSLKESIAVNTDLSEDVKATL